ncbi:MAG: hypothetical protein HOO06_07840 [Bdellovibrionaceae bacterium]|jgi:hypothetical protein|nr:hypothetical protein [Pseudobdellovibrionaceae bacterium]
MKSLVLLIVLLGMFSSLFARELYSKKMYPKNIFSLTNLTSAYNSKSGGTLEQASATLLDISKFNYKNIKSDDCYYITADHTLGLKPIGDTSVFLTSKKHKTVPVMIIGRDWGTETALLKGMDSKDCRGIKKANLDTDLVLPQKETEAYGSAYLSGSHNNFLATTLKIQNLNSQSIKRPDVQNEIIAIGVGGFGISGGSVSLDEKNDQMVGLFSSLSTRTFQKVSNITMHVVGARDIKSGLDVMLGGKKRSYSYDYENEIIKFNGVEFYSPLETRPTATASIIPHGTGNSLSIGAQIVGLSTELFNDSRNSPYLSSWKSEQDLLATVILENGERRVITSVSDYIRLELNGRVQKVGIISLYPGQKSVFTLNIEGLKNAAEVLKAELDSNSYSTDHKFSQFLSTVISQDHPTYVILYNDLLSNEDEFSQFISDDLFKPFTQLTTTLEALASHEKNSKN